ncbi:hypothetical protein HYC85_009738 [Camellia sinensis]|uniref:Uncharacterized protein n=1 Tax=Camellia sinensis TaxID=4442 RepID=A0A7J7HII4_CAMSI|nr:hypothetical protein HYC85_009738 [Camellia sinensis]
MAYHPSILQSYLLALAALQSIVAVKFDVKNVARTSPGGARFTKEIRVNEKYESLQGNNAADRRDIVEVLMVIENHRDLKGDTYGNIINIRAIYLLEIQGNVKWAFTSLIYHEMTQVWQWFGGPDKALTGLIEGTWAWFCGGAKQDDEG